jgi:16S rRNA (guanine527-N7)-methyltransferase
VKRNLREDLHRLAGSYSLPALAEERLSRLLTALAGEPSPPTTVCDPVEALDTHVADSLCALALEELADAERIADIGSGAGFPGLPLAIALPDTTVDLVDSNRRSCLVVERLIAAAGVPNATVLEVRAEELAVAVGREAYDVVTARAVGPLPVLVEYAAPLLRADGRLIAWKAVRREDDERAGAAAAVQLGLEPAGVHRVTPFEGARNRHLHVYRKVGATPARFPRRPGVAAKRPLA